jgi:phosphatidylserine/phosphatidylglycerophosphate/cardiolipin synthase-like enzyme
LDIISDAETISKDILFDKLAEFGFSEIRIRQMLDLLNFHSQINVADLTRIDCTKSMHKPVAVTYPAYDNRGIPAKNPYKNSITGTLEGIQGIIYSAQRKILILSPYAEASGLDYFRDMLISKLKNKVEVRLIVRELYDKTSRSDRLIMWVKKNLSMYDNFSLYDYHYVFDGHIESTSHAKVVASDDKIAYVGSGDIRKRAFNTNLEMGTIHRGYNARVISSIVSDLADVAKEYPLR